MLLIRMTQRERILHSIRRAEARLTMFKMFRWATKPSDDSGILMVRVPKDPTANPRDPATKEWVDVHDPPTMESHTLDYLKQHFSMAKSTPFASDDFKLINAMISNHKWQLLR